MPPFIDNSEEELSNHRTQATKALKYIHDQYNILTSLCENHLALEGSYRSRPTEYTHYETQLKKLQRELDTHENKVFKLDQCLKTSETDLKNLRSKNEEIQDEILQISENIDKLALQGEQLAKQRKEDTESMQLLWRSYVMAKNFYKKNLQCHIRLHEPAESQDGSPSSELEGTLTFSYHMDDKTLLEAKLNRNNNTWKGKLMNIMYIFLPQAKFPIMFFVSVLDVQPFVPASVEAQKHLHETNDIRHFVYCLWVEADKLFKK